jgi:glycosyltransferase involved in cell wall biosynthesis
MRIVVDAAGLTAGGGKELAFDLLTRLQQFRRHQFILFAPDLAEYRRIAGSNIHCLYFTGSRGLLSRWRALERNLPRLCITHRADALLCLGNMAPSGSPCPTAVLIQNAYLAYREPVAERRLTFRERLIIRYTRTALRRLAGHTRLIVQTPVMRERILSALPFSPAPAGITVIPNPAPRCPAANYGHRNGRRSFSRPFTFLCLTRYYAHKNLEILPGVLTQLSRLTSQPFRCLMTISRMQHPNAGKLLRRVQTMGLGEVLVNLGPVERQALPFTFGSADALLLPTLLESYSRTYSEAMNHGLPILTSDRDFARHLCGNAALYFDPLDAASVAKRMAEVMTNAELRETLITNGHQIVSSLPDWGEVAARFIAVLEQSAETARLPHKHTITDSQSSLPTQRSPVTSPR